MEQQEKQKKTKMKENKTEPKKHTNTMQEHSKPINTKNTKRNNMEDNEKVNK